MPGNRGTSPPASADGKRYQNTSRHPKMNKLTALAIIIFTIFLILFTTWHLFKGNLEAAFMPLPFLLVVYFFVKHGK